MSTRCTTTATVNLLRCYGWGDLVWVDATDITTDRPSTKLAHRRLGPYPIDARVGHGAYRLKLPPLSRLHLVFPIVKLTLATPDPIVGRRAKPPPPPVLIGGEEEHEVEAILDSRMHWNCLEYLVKWKGYNIGDNTWVVHRDSRRPCAGCRSRISSPEPRSPSSHQRRLL
jgi:hypothetical protein